VVLQDDRLAADHAKAASIDAKTTLPDTLMMDSIAARAAGEKSALPAGFCHALPCPGLPCPALLCPVQPCTALPCFAGLCPVLPCAALSCPALSSHI